jgi:hypothetical protein
MKTGKTAAKSENRRCTTCGATEKKLATQADEQLCPNCLAIVELLKKSPDSFRKLSRIAGYSDPSHLRQKQIEQELPDVLDAVRYRTSDRDRNTWYVSVSELEGNPVEIFASTAFDRDQHLQSRISNLTTITRLISLILRHVFMGEKLTLEKTLTQLHRSSRQPDDLPAMLGKILANYSKKKTVDFDRDPATIP